MVCGACGGGGATTPANSNAAAANANVRSGGSNVQGAGSDAGAPVAGPAHDRAAPAAPASSMGGGGQAIDTSKYDAEIARLQKQVEKKGAGGEDRLALSHAYLDRANALTKAKQYRAALGDYRRTLKYDPQNDEALQMAGTIISILRQMGRDIPQEGAEPSPLPYKQ
jgi:tetratricopeptide (TPR) repeat protein